MAKAKNEKPSAKEVTESQSNTTEAAETVPQQQQQGQPEGEQSLDSMKFEDSESLFETVDTGEFLIWEAKKDAVLEGVYQGETKDHPLTDREGNPKFMLQFRDQYGQRILVNQYYSLYRHFVNDESQTKADRQRPILWRVTCTGEESTKKGDTVKTFRIQFAYLDKPEAKELLAKYQQHL